MTAVTASSTGTPAAASAPNASTRIASVIGSDSFCAFARSSLIDLFTAFCTLASPNCSMRSVGCARLAAAVAASSGSTLSIFVYCSSPAVPLTSNVTSAERPPWES